MPLTAEGFAVSRTLQSYRQRACARRPETV